MKNKDLAFILLRVLSIYLFIQSIIYLGQTINFTVISSLSTFNQMGIENNIAILNLVLGAIAPFIFLLVISIIIWIFTDKISKYIIQGNIVNENDSDINLNNVQTMIFSIIGVLIVSLTLPKTFILIPDFFKMNEITYGLATSQFKKEIIFSIVGITVKLLIGFALIIWSNKLTKLLNRLK